MTSSGVEPWIKRHLTCRPSPFASHPSYFPLRILPSWENKRQTSIQALSKSTSLGSSPLRTCGVLKSWVQERYLGCDLSPHRTAVAVIWKNHELPFERPQTRSVKLQLQPIGTVFPLDAIESMSVQFISFSFSTLRIDSGTYARTTVFLKQLLHTRQRQ